MQWRKGVDYIDGESTSSLKTIPSHSQKFIPTLPLGMPGPHFAERLLQLRLHGRRDPLRSRGDFSDDIQQVHGILHNPKARKSSKIVAYRNWLKSHQPCVFGRGAAGKRQVFICLLDEREILSMRRGDADLRATLEDYRKVWKRYALHGRSSSLVIVVNSQALAYVEPSDELKEACRRLMELYVGAQVEDDTILEQHEYVYLAKTINARRTFLKFATLPNLFCAQGDRRWWHDHRTPGGIMITSNALGHFMHCLTAEPEPDRRRALKQAMMTIQNAHRSNKRGFKQPATELVPRGEGEASPLEGTAFGQFSPCRYQGYFHTDHLISSVFFQKRQPIQIFEDLGLTYMHNPDEEDYDELMGGEVTNAYTIRSQVWLPDGKDLARDFTFEKTERDEAHRWLESRVWARCR